MGGNTDEDQVVKESEEGDVSMNRETTMNRIITTSAIFLLVACCGCAHRLEITNLDDYCTNGDMIQCKNYSVSVEFKTPISPGSAYVFESEAALREQLEFELSKRGCVINRKDNPEYQISCEVDTTYSANGLNFLVSWPGFIIFTHAWLGYGYDAQYWIRCEISTLADKNVVGRIEDTINLHVRYADFGTTWAAGCGWIPYIGVISSMANGIYVATTCDDDMIPELQEKACHVIASAIADELVKKINARSRVEL